MHGALALLKAVETQCVRTLEEASAELDEHTGNVETEGVAVRELEAYTVGNRVSRFAAAVEALLKR